MLSGETRLLAWRSLVLVAVLRLEAVDSRAHRLFSFAARTSTGRCPAAVWGSVAILFVRHNIGVVGTILLYCHVIGYSLVMTFQRGSGDTAIHVNEIRTGHNLDPKHEDGVQE